MDRCIARLPRHCRLHLPECLQRGRDRLILIDWCKRLKRWRQLGLVQCRLFVSCAGLVDLLVDFLEATFSPVLDPCLGTGGTACLAAELRNRCGELIEGTQCAVECCGKVGGDVAGCRSSLVS